MALRESEPLYDAVRQGGGIGIPCFVLENGEKTLDLGKVLAGC